MKIATIGPICARDATAYFLAAVDRPALIDGQEVRRTFGLTDEEIAEIRSAYERFANTDRTGPNVVIESGADALAVARGLMAILDTQDRFNRGEASDTDVYVAQATLADLIRRKQVAMYERTQGR